MKSNASGCYKNAVYLCDLLSILPNISPRSTPFPPPPGSPAKVFEGYSESCLQPFPNDFTAAGMWYIKTAGFC